jgi:hypothetical protein
MEVQVLQVKIVKHICWTGLTANGANSKGFSQDPRQPPDIVGNQH